MYTDIKTVDDAFANHPAKIDLEKTLKALADLPANISRGLIALLKLQVIVFAVNNDEPGQPEWIADYNNKDQYKWFPWYVGGDRSGSGFRFGESYCLWAYAYTTGGARLALKDEERAEHMNEHFADLYKELYLILD